MFYIIRYEKNYLFQTFLLFDESERDRRLLSICGEHLSAGKMMSKDEKDVVQEKTKRPTKVECNLQQAEWEQVMIVFNIFLLK